MLNLAQLYGRAEVLSALARALELATCENMTRPETLPKPIDLLAAALECPPDSLSAESAMYRDYGWDSFGHLRVVLALEQAYRIEASESNFTKYTTLQAIQNLYERLIGGDEIT